MQVASRAIEPNHRINSHIVRTTSINSGCMLPPPYSQFVKHRDHEETPELYLEIPLVTIKCTRPGSSFCHREGRKPRSALGFLILSLRGASATKQSRLKSVILSVAKNLTWLRINSATEESQVGNNTMRLPRLRLAMTPGTLPNVTEVSPKGYSIPLWLGV